MVLVKKKKKKKINNFSLGFKILNLGGIFSTHPIYTRNIYISQKILFKLSQNLYHNATS